MLHQEFILYQSSKYNPQEGVEAVKFNLMLEEKVNTIICFLEVNLFYFNIEGHQFCFNFILSLF
jgi:hypothetical protein